MQVFVCAKGVTRVYTLGCFHTMKYLPIIFAFLVGLATAWIVWDFYLLKVQREEVALNLYLRVDEAKISEEILNYVITQTQSKVSTCHIFQVMP